MDVLLFSKKYIKHKWVQVFKNRPRKICRIQPLKNFTWLILEYLDPNVTKVQQSKIAIWSD